MLTSFAKQQSFEAIENLKTIQSALSAEEKNLVIFDIDGTLIVPSSALLDLSICPRSFLKQLSSVYENKEDLFEEMFHKALKECPQKLTETDIPKLLRRIEKKNAKMIALTNRRKDKRTFLQFKSVGLDFSTSFEHLEYLDLEQKSAGKPSPSFYKGVIFAAGKDKGKTLGKFLDQINYVPQKVIFIDDQEHFLASVDAELTRRGISHICYHYIGWEKNKPKEFDTSLASFQWLYFLVNEKWIVDEKAKLLCNPL